MDWVKRNWLILLVAPVVLYFAYLYFMSKYDLAKKMQLVRDAKEDKRILSEDENVTGT